MLYDQRRYLSKGWLNPCLDLVPTLRGPVLQTNRSLLVRELKWIENPRIAVRLGGYWRLRSSEVTYLPSTDFKHRR